MSRLDDALVPCASAGNIVAAIRPLIFVVVMFAAVTSVIAEQPGESLGVADRLIEFEILNPSLSLDAYFDDATGACDAIVQQTLSSKQANHAKPFEWYCLPEGLLWRSYLAGPQEPRISTVLFGDTDSGKFWDATLGGRVGLLRYGTPGARNARGWQWDLEGAVITRLDLGHAEDVESADYRFGTEITAAEGNWSAKFGYFHISSHLGDEFMIRNPGFSRINYVIESLVGGLGYTVSDEVRLYGETAYAYHVAGGADRWQIQGGVEYSPITTYLPCGAPFAAINLDFRQSVDFDPTMNLQTGWQWKSIDSGRSLRLGLEYFHGRSSQFQFFQRREEHWGCGAWFDY